MFNVAAFSMARTRELLVALVPVESVIENTSEELPATAGVPLMTQSESDSPPGKFPDATEQV